MVSAATTNTVPNFPSQLTRASWNPQLRKEAAANPDSQILRAVLAYQAHLHQQQAKKARILVEEELDDIFGPHSFVAWPGWDLITTPLLRLYDLNRSSSQCSAQSERLSIKYRYGLAEKVPGFVLCCRR
jgi:hypothetical protein